jgi:hypothetical protein
VAATFIKSELTGGFLAVNANEGANSPNAHIIQYSFTGDGTQQWQLNPGPMAGTVEIENLGSGLAVTDPGDSQNGGTQLVQAPFTGDAGQLWREWTVTGAPNAPGGQDVAFQNVLTNQWLNVSGGSSLNFTPIIQWPEFGNTIPQNEQFILSDGSN